MPGHGRASWVVRKRPARERDVAVSVDECENYGRSVRSWPTFPESPGALQSLKKYDKLVILPHIEPRGSSVPDQMQRSGVIPPR